VVEAGDENKARARRAKIKIAASAAIFDVFY